MKRTTLWVLLCSMACTISMAQHAHNDSIHPSVVIESNHHNNAQHNSYEVMKAMYEANGLHFQDPRAPRFLFLDRKGRVALGIGGYVKATMSVGMAGIANNIDFVTATIPTPAQANMRNQFMMDASTSRIFLKLVGRNNIVGNFTIYLESDFRGSASSYFAMRLRQAYVQLWNIKVGRSWSTFCDVAAIQPTIDFQGPSGASLTMNLMVQYSKQFGPHWEMAVAVETPSATYTTRNIYNDAIKQRVPDVPAYVQFNWREGKSHIRLSGLFRALSYRNLVSDKNQFAIGWAGQLSSVIQLASHWTLYSQLSYGRGYASYLNDLGGYGYDLVPDERNGAMTAPYALGIANGVQYTLKPGLFFSVGYSQCRLFDTPTLPASSYHYGQYLAVNAFWSPFPNCQVGIEYLYGNRHNTNNESGSAHRINAMIQYNF